MSEEKPELKRKHEDGSGSESDASSEDGWVGPLPSEAAEPKKRKGHKNC